MSSGLLSKQFTNLVIDTLKQVDLLFPLSNKISLFTLVVRVPEEANI